MGDTDAILSILSGRSGQVGGGEAAAVGEKQGKGAVAVVSGLGDPDAILAVGAVLPIGTPEVRGGEAAAVGEEQGEGAVAVVSGLGDADAILAVGAVLPIGAP